MKLPYHLAIPLWVVCWGISAAITCRLAFDYIQAVLGFHVSAQWQFAFLLVPIPIIAALLSLILCFLASPRLSKSCVALSLAGAVVPGVLLLLVVFKIY